VLVKLIKLFTRVVLVFISLVLLIPIMVILFLLTLQGQTCVKTNIDTTAMVAIPTIVVGADQQLHIGSDLIKLGVGNGYEVNATNGQEGLAHVSKVH
jgi:hypothetical protein